MPAQQVPSFKMTSEQACRRSAMKKVLRRWLPTVAELEPLVRKARSALSEFQLRGGNQASSSMSGDIHDIAVDPTHLFMLSEANFYIAAPPPDLSYRQHHSRQRVPQILSGRTTPRAAGTVQDAAGDISDDFPSTRVYVPPLIQSAILSPDFSGAAGTRPNAWSMIYLPASLSMQHAGVFNSVYLDD